METFVSKHSEDVTGTLSGFDRLVFRGTLRRMVYSGGMMAYLWAAGVLLKDFAEHALEVTERLKAASCKAAQCVGRPVRYLVSSKTDKESEARKIVEEDGLQDGLIC